MSIQVEYYFLMFFICSVLGWIMEVTCKLIQFHRFINRGFLLGPYCPIYGFGAVLVAATLESFSVHPLAVFGLAVLLCGILEYFTSWAMEKLFHARWWDYSKKKFNINGRVCLNTLIPFGLLGLTMVYLIKPFCFKLFESFSPLLTEVLCISLAVILLADTVISSNVLVKIRRSAGNQTGDSTEAITKNVREELMKRSVLLRRLLRAFPYAQMYNAEIRKKLAAQRKALRAELAEKRKGITRQLDEIAGKIHK